MDNKGDKESTLVTWIVVGGILVALLIVMFDLFYLGGGYGR